MDFARARDEESEKKTVAGGKEMGIEGERERSGGTEAENKGRNDRGGRRMRAGAKWKKSTRGWTPRWM